MNKIALTGTAMALASTVLAGTTRADVVVECPGDKDGDAVVDGGKPGGAGCQHVAGTDGFVRMADGKEMYIFGFAPATGLPQDEVIALTREKAVFPAPTLVAREGEEFYLTLSNSGFVNRPDLFDPHTVHYHGFPNAASVYDGEPEASFGVNVSQSFTYYYNFREPGTYLYHCHQEAAEHMQMGMLGNAYVLPAQDQLKKGTALAGGFVHQDGFRYAYNDGDGSTYYDVDVALQLSSFDRTFHDASNATQPLPFALMQVDYPMINGRGYPDTTKAAVDPALPTQPLNSLVRATVGQKVLLRLSSLDVTRYYTISSPHIPMKVVGTGARILRSGGLPAGEDLYYETHVLQLGGGEARDVILDLAGVPPGTYALHTTNLNFLSNAEEDFGGLMTEIVVEPS